MNEQVFRALLAHYQAQGISLERLLKDPVFNDMPLDEKIRLVHKYASYMKSGISTDKQDLTGHAVNATLAGIGATQILKALRLASMENQTGNPAFGTKSGLLTAIGTSLVGTGAYLSYKKYQDKQKIKELLNNNKTEGLPNTVQILSQNLPRQSETNHLTTLIQVPLLLNQIKPR